MIEIIVIIVLSILLLGQALERHITTKDLTQKLDDAIKASLSRNINDYITAKAADKPAPQAFIENDNVPLDEADDETFNKFIPEQKK